MSLVASLRGKARTLADELRREDLDAVDKAMLIAQRSLAVAGLSAHVSIGRHDIYELGAPPAPVGDARALVVRPAEDRDLDGLCDVEETPPAKVLERRRRGDLAYVGVHEGRVVGHAWFHKGPRPFVEDEPLLARFALLPATYWSYGGASAAALDESSTGTLATILGAALAELFADRGAERVQCRVPRADTVAIALHERLGFKRLGTFSGFATPWLRSIVWDGPPTRSFVFGPNSTRALLLPL